MERVELHVEQIGSAIGNGAAERYIELPIACSVGDKHSNDRKGENEHGKERNETGPGCMAAGP